MAPFRQAKDQTADEQRAQAGFDWAHSVSPADLAAELMAAFGQSALSTASVWLTGCPICMQAVRQRAIGVI